MKEKEDGGYSWGEYDAEEHPRNAGAIRTALMLGAEFEQHPGGGWSEKTINSVFYNRGILAFMFIATHGLGIDEHGSPYFLRNPKE